MRQPPDHSRARTNETHDRLAAARPAFRIWAAYAADLASWRTWREAVGVDVLAAGIHHADAYLRLLAERTDTRTGHPLAAASIARRTAALHGFYRYATRQGAVAGSPFTNAQRPAVDDESMSPGPTRREVHALLATARAHSPRSAALVSLLLLNGLRMSARPASLASHASHPFEPPLTVNDCRDDPRPHCEHRPPRRRRSQRCAGAVDRGLHPRPGRPRPRSRR